MLREIEAKRRIIALHSDSRGGDPACSSIVYQEPAEECETLRAMTLPYADRPGYDEACRP